MAQEKKFELEKEGWEFHFYPGVLRSIEKFLAESKNNERTIEEIIDHLTKVPKDSRWFRLLPKTAAGYPFVAQHGQKIRISGLVDDLKRIIRLTHFDSHA